MAAIAYNRLYAQVPALLVRERFSTFSGGADAFRRTMLFQTIRPIQTATHGAHDRSHMGSMVATSTPAGEHNLAAVAEHDSAGRMASECPSHPVTD